MLRTYQSLLSEHFKQNRQMVFLMGPRQVGKTTLAMSIGDSFHESHYLNWDNRGNRLKILAGPDAVAEYLGLDKLREARPLVIFDELHKFRGWKDFLKGFFDCYGDQIKILVTGSARLDIFRSGGDSLMGRYFAYRLHPLSLAEINGVLGSEELISRHPSPVSVEDMARLSHYGGFPEPYMKQDRRFLTRWRKTCDRQLFKEDLRDLTRIQELGQVEVLAQLLNQQAGQLTSYASLAKSVAVSQNTIKSWTGTLESFYYCFSIKPWYKNVARSLRKEPKFYLWDWSKVKDKGLRNENIVAAALFKAVHFWSDAGYGDFGLFYLRDKQKREVDFVVTRDDMPWFLVEVQSSGKASLSPSLAYFQKATNAEFAFQVAMDLPFQQVDCFSINRPMIVPGATFLAQLT